VARPQAKFNIILNAMNLASIEEMLGAFKKSGLKVKFDEKGISGRGMYIAKVET
jgi:hypothetical protein